MLTRDWVVCTKTVSNRNIRPNARTVKMTDLKIQPETRLIVQRIPMKKING
jgi:hypothetical protein